MMIKTEAVWTHEPAVWQWDERGRLIAQARPQTHFWRKTRSGFISENGHLYAVQVRGDFIAQVRVSGRFESPYDQAGLMVMADPTTWLRAGIEYIEGTCYLTSVLTCDFSDWAISRPIDTGNIWLRMERDRDAVVVSASLNGKRYFPVRECRFSDALALDVGPYLASPMGQGFRVAFEELEIIQPRQPRP